MAGAVDLLCNTILYSKAGWVESAIVFYSQLLPTGRGPHRAFSRSVFSASGRKRLLGHLNPDRLLFSSTPRQKIWFLELLPFPIHSQEFRVAPADAWLMPCSYQVFRNKSWTSVDKSAIVRKGGGDACNAARAFLCKTLQKDCCIPAKTQRSNSASPFARWTTCWRIDSSGRDA